MSLKDLHTFLLAGAILWLAMCAGLRAAPVTVFAAASLTESLQQVAALYEAKSGDQIVFNFAASGPLVRQIEAGAPADLFISADQSHMDELAARGLIVTASRQDLLGNTLVIVTPPEDTTIRGPADLTNAAVQRIALGELKTVPCGTYARQYFVQIGLWAAVAPKVIPCQSVRAVLATVGSGNVDAGVVYKTDAAISKNVRVAYEVPAGAGPKITYPAALVKDSPNPAAAQEFLTFLASQEAAQIFRRHGFIILTP